MSAVARTSVGSGSIEKTVYLTAVYPDIVLDEEIDKLHFQDASLKQVMNGLVLLPGLNSYFSLLEGGSAGGG